MMGIIDCKQIDDVKEIEACCVQATAGEVDDLSWATKTNRAAARWERKLLLTLMAGAPAASSAGGRGADESA